MRADITLRGETAERFEQLREEYGDRIRDGDVPTRPEFARLLMDEFDV